MVSMSRRSVVRGQAARVSPMAGEQIKLGCDSALDGRRGETERLWKQTGNGCLGGVGRAQVKANR